MVTSIESEITHRAEVARSMDGFVEENLGLLKPVSESWQPSDFLPDMSQLGWQEDVEKLRETTSAISPELLVVLVGDMVTEEALPSYQTTLNRIAGVADATGSSPSAWGRWSRGWTAEENRHGDLLNRFLYLTGRVNMRSVETTIQHLIRNGFNPGTADDPYKAFVYTSFQERATRISHTNVAKLAKAQGDALLNHICGLIAGDESRHETAYTKFMSRIFTLDPQGAICAFRDVIQKMVAMPAALMTDGSDASLFDHFAAVAQRIGVYTAHDYADILDHLKKHWNVAAMTGLHGDAASAQDFICNAAERYHRLADRVKDKIARQAPVKFSWIFNEAV